VSASTQNVAIRLSRSNLVIQAARYVAAGRRPEAVIDALRLDRKSWDRSGGRELVLSERDFEGVVAAVCRSEAHSFSKPCVEAIVLLAGLGVEGDAHLGKTVQHRSRVAADPSQPNLRQVHLIQEELHAELRAQGFLVGPGSMGENITTRGLDLLGLPRGARVRIGPDAIVDVTGLRNPCKQLDDFQSGLMRAVLDRAPDGELIRKAGVMGIVLNGGVVGPGDRITANLPNGPHARLERV